MILWLATLGAGVLVAGVAAPGSGQIGGQFGGSVTDESGAALPGAKITAASTSTAFSQSVYARGDGSFLFPSLPPGPYQATVELNGFKTIYRSIFVIADQSVVIYFQMQVASA